MDMFYATIPMEGGSKRLYYEKISPFLVNIQDRLDDNTIYVVDTDLGSLVFFNYVSPINIEIIVPIGGEEEEESVKKQEALQKKQKDEGLWTMYFDGSMDKVGAGAALS